MSDSDKGKLDKMFDGLTKQESLVLRRKTVHSMIIQGADLKTVAKVLGISYDTVRADLKALEDKGIEELQKFDEYSYLWKKLSEFRELQAILWSEIRSQGENENKRANYARTLSDIMEKEIRLFQDLGLVSKIGEKLVVTTEQPKEIDSKQKVKNLAEIKEMFGLGS